MSNEVGIIKENTTDILQDVIGIIEQAKSNATRSVARHRDEIESALKKLKTINHNQRHRSHIKTRKNKTCTNKTSIITN